MVGALIMAHSDNNGLILPPRLAPLQVVIVPIYKTSEQLEKINEKAGKIKTGLEKAGITVKLDNRENFKPGFKFADYELKGVPVRIAIGPRDIEQNSVEIARRDTLEKTTIGSDGITEYIQNLLGEIQDNIYRKALNFKSENTFYIDKWSEFLEIIDGQGGFIMAHWDGTSETEEKIKEETKATIRCIPFDAPAEEGRCIYSGRPSSRRVLFARSY
jgi:prolyl-tRNA synthetase